MFHSTATTYFWALAKVLILRSKSYCLGGLEIYHLSSLKFVKALKNLRNSAQKISTPKASPSKNYYDTTSSIGGNQDVEQSNKLVKMGVSGIN